MRPGRDINHAHPSRAEVKETVKLYLCSSAGLSRTVEGRICHCTIYGSCCGCSVKLPRRRFCVFCSRAGAIAGIRKKIKPSWYSQNCDTSLWAGSRHFRTLHPIIHNLFQYYISIYAKVHLVRFGFCFTCNNFLPIFLVSSMTASYSLQLSEFYYSNNLWPEVQLMEILFVTFILSSRSFLPLILKCFPYNLFIEHFQNIFPSQSETTNSVFT